VSHSGGCALGRTPRTRADAARWRSSVAADPVAVTSRDATNACGKPHVSATASSQAVSSTGSGPAYAASMCTDFTTFAP
jgi:hypothetical protein